MSTREAKTFGPEYALVTDGQEIDYIMQNYVNAEDFDDFGSLFVKVGEGEYLELWGSWHIVCDNGTIYQSVPLAC